MVTTIKPRTETPPEEGGQASTAGGVESLADLAREATAASQAEQQQAGAAIVTQQQAEQRQAADQTAAAAAEIAGLLVMVRDFAGETAEEAGYLPQGRTVEIWSDDRLGKISVPLVMVMERHGGELGALMEKFGPYVMLLAATAIPATATMKAVRLQRAARQAAKPAEVAASGQQ